MNEDRIEELYDQVYEMLEGPEKVAAFEEIVRLVDAQRDEQLSYSARIELIEAANTIGMHDRAMVAFSWCLARHDKMEDAIDLHELLWYFKWILQSITRIAAVDADKIIALEDDMARRLVATSHSLRPIEYIRCINRVRMGQLDEARRDFQRWQKAKRDAMADCRACELDNEVEFYAAMGDDEQAINIGTPLATGKTKGCAEVPHHTFGKLVRPLLRLGRIDEAGERFIASMRRIRGNMNFLAGVAEEMLYLVRVGERVKLIRLLDKHLPLVAASVDDDARCRFYKATALALDLFAAKTKKDQKLVIPTSLACHREDHTYDPAELAGWFHEEAKQLAERFDARNGNNRYGKLLAESETLVAG